MNASEVDALFGHWIVPAVDQARYDVFVSYRWGTHDSPLTAMLVDHLEWYTVGEAHPRPLVAFLDRRSLELGKDFQESFVEALTHSTVVVPIVSHAALDRMVTHNPNAEDNVLVEWLCSLFLRTRQLLHSLLPVFVGARGGVDSGGALDRHGLGANFFAPVAAHGNQSILQALPDVAPTATLRKAVELLQKTGVWPAHAAREASQVDPQLFGLQAFSVRAVVTALTKFNGVFADADGHASMFDLLSSVGGATHDLVAGAEGKSRPVTPVPTVHDGASAPLRALDMGGDGDGDAAVSPSPAKSGQPPPAAVVTVVTDSQLLAWFESGPKLQGSYAALVQEAKLPAVADTMGDVAAFLEGISFEVIANAYTNDNKGADKDVFKSEMASCGVTTLVALKLYTYLKNVAEDLGKGGHG
jgi:hypothetical protein